MAKYMIQGFYTPEGARGLLKEGGSGRKKAVEEMIGKFGGKVECFYYAFGKNDVVVIFDLPDNVTAASISFAVASAGAVKTQTTVLLTTEEMDQAVQKSVSYRAPGQ